MLCEMLLLQVLINREFIQSPTLTAYNTIAKLASSKLVFASMLLIQAHLASAAKEKNKALFQIHVVYTLALGVIFFHMKPSLYVAMAALIIIGGSLILIFLR